MDSKERWGEFNEIFLRTHVDIPQNLSLDDLKCLSLIMIERLTLLINEVLLFKLEQNERSRLCSILLEVQVYKKNLEVNENMAGNAYTLLVLWGTAIENLSIRLKAAD